MYMHINNCMTSDCFMYNVYVSMFDVRYNQLYYDNIIIFLNITCHMWCVLYMHINTFMMSDCFMYNVHVLMFDCAYNQSYFDDMSTFFKIIRQLLYNLYIEINKYNIIFFYDADY